MKIQVFRYTRLFAVASGITVLMLVPSFVHAQDDVLPGGRRVSGRQLQKEYTSMVLRGVELFHQAWERACNTGNIKNISELYLKNSEVLTLNRTTIRTRDSISAWYKAGLPRMKGCRMTFGEIVSSGEIASIHGSIRYDLQLPTGGSLAQTVTFQMILRQLYIDEWRIESQTGGDLPPMIVGIVPTDAAVAGTMDSLGVQVTDGVGHPLQNVLVVFAVEKKDGEVKTLPCITDHMGRAIAKGQDWTSRDISRIRVATSLNKEVIYFAMAPKSEGETSRPAGDQAK